MKVMLRNNHWIVTRFEYVFIVIYRSICVYLHFHMYKHTLCKGGHLNTSGSQTLWIALASLENYTLMFV